MAGDGDALFHGAFLFTMIDNLSLEIGGCVDKLTLGNDAQGHGQNLARITESGHPDVAGSP